MGAMRLRGPLLGLGLAVALLVVIPASAWACSCVGGSTEQRLSQSRHAVIAKLVDVRIVESNELGPGSGVFVYKLKRVLKGGEHLRSKRRIRIRSTMDGASCGLPRRHPKRYGLFLYREHSGRLSANLCSVVSPRALRRAAQGKDPSSRLAASRAPACRTTRS